MSALILSDWCGGMTPIGPIEFDIEPDHDACPGGQTTPGLMGGWTCSCECHLREFADESATIARETFDAQREALNNTLNRWEQPMTVHDLKIDEPFLDALLDGSKTFEIRYNDRGYQTGDRLEFWHSAGSKFVQFDVTYVLSGHGLKEGYVCLGVKRVLL